MASRLAQAAGLCTPCRAGLVAVDLQSAPGAHESGCQGLLGARWRGLVLGVLRGGGRSFVVSESGGDEPYENCAEGCCQASADGADGRRGEAGYDAGFEVSELRAGDPMM